MNILVTGRDKTTDRKREHIWTYVYPECSVNGRDGVECTLCGKWHPNMPQAITDYSKCSLWDRP